MWERKVEIAQVCVCVCNNSSLLQYVLGRVPPAVPSFLASITAIVSSTKYNFEHMRTIISC